MSSSKSLVNGRKLSPEKSTFAQTCNRLSQLLKEKDGLKHRINAKFEASGRAETSTCATLHLTTHTHLSDQILTTQNHVNHSPKSPTRDSYDSVQDVINITSSSEEAKMEPKTAQMTIFYAGKIMVFDDFSEDKAKEVMLLAKKGTTGFVEVSSSAPHKIIDVPFPSDIPSSSRTPETLQNQTQPVNSDLPIARRASLHRFLEKRKDRATARSPYQLHNASATSNKEPFDLNL